MMWFNFETFSMAVLLLCPSSQALAFPRPVLDAQLISHTRLIEREEADALAPKVSIRSAYDAGVFARAEELFKRKGGGGGKGGSGYVSSSSRRSNYGSSGENRAAGKRPGSSSRSSSSMASSRSCARAGDSGLEDRMAEGGGGCHSGGRSGRSYSPRPKSDIFHSSSGRGSSSSSTGGATKQGSGVQPSYGGGRYYGGGATTPYTSGGRSPLGITPLFLGAGALTFFPGVWLYGAYNYPYGHPYSFHNRTGRANNTANSNNVRRDFETDYGHESGVDETKPVTCLCAAYAECGCDDNGDATFLDALIGDGTYSQLNQSVVNVVDLNGTNTIVLNGTLSNGTTISGGTDDANAGAGLKKLLEASGYWVMIPLVGCTVLLV